MLNLLMNSIDTSKYYNKLIDSPIEEDVKTKKTNSTGDMTPNLSINLSTDLMDTYYQNNRELNNQVEIIQINSILKINEYKERELSLLEESNKRVIVKKPFREVVNKLNSMVSSIDKCFVIPKKLLKEPLKKSSIDIKYK